MYVDGETCFVGRDLEQEVVDSLHHPYVGEAGQCAQLRVDALIWPTFFHSEYRWTIVQLRNCENWIVEALQILWVLMFADGCGVGNGRGD